MVAVISGLNPNQGPKAGGNTVTINGTGFTNVILVRFGIKSAPFTVASSTKITTTAPSGNGPVSVTVTTSAGTSNGVLYSYTNTPGITGINPAQGSAAGGTTVTITGTNFTGATSVNFGMVSAAFTVVSATQITATAPAGPVGQVNVTVTTPAGTSNPVTYSYVTTPTVIWIDPTMGPEGGGSTVTIIGSGLSLTNSVLFGSHQATNIHVLSDDHITADTPAGTGTVIVTVITPGGSSSPGPGGSYFSYLGTPVIDSLVPDSGPAYGGTNVAISGSNLTYTDEVRFDGDTAAFAAVSDSLVVATAPAGTPGTVNVVVHTPGGDSNPLLYQYEP